MMKKEFKVKLSPAVIYFQLFYLVFIGWKLLEREYQMALISGIGGVLIIGYMNLCRPYKYSFERKTLSIHKRIGKPKEINLMTCETICDPLPKMSKIVADPHSLEIYTDKKKRIVVVPSYRMDFVQAVLYANKRIHVQVEEYARNHKSLQRQQRKIRKKAKEEA